MLLQSYKLSKQKLRDFMEFLYPNLEWDDEVT